MEFRMRVYTKKEKKEKDKHSSLLLSFLSLTSNSERECAKWSDGHSSLPIFPEGVRVHRGPTGPIRETQRVCERSPSR